MWCLSLKHDYRPFWVTKFIAYTIVFFSWKDRLIQFCIYTLVPIKLSSLCFIIDNEMDSQTTVKSFILPNKQINHAALTHTLMHTWELELQAVKIPTCPKRDQEKDFCLKQEGWLFTRCQGVGIQAQISYRETLSLWTSLQDPVWPGLAWSSRYFMFWLTLVSHKNKVKIC